MAMKYDYVLYKSDRIMETPAVSMGFPIEIAWGLKLIWSIVIIGIAVACIIFPPANEKKPKSS